MEFDSRFSEIKATLEIFQVKNSVKLSQYGFSTTEASKKQVEELMDSLKKIKLFTDGSKDDLQKLHFFLLLNTDLPVSEELEEDQNCCHLVGRCPKLSTYIYFLIVNYLELFSYMAECILYVPSPFSQAIVALFIENVKYMPDSKCELMLIGKILISIYQKLNHKLAMTSSATELIAHFQRIIIMFKNPALFSSNQLKKSSKVIIHSFYGMSVLHLATVLIECTKDSFEKNSGENFTSDSLKELYTFSRFKPSSDSKCESLNLMTDCYESILDVFKSILMEKITPIVLMDWCEIDLSPQRSLQRTIGELIYICRQTLMKVNPELLNKSLQKLMDDMIQVLVHLEVKPRSPADEWKELDVDTLAAKFDESCSTNKDEINLLMLQILIDNPETVKKPEVIKIIQKNGSALKYDIIESLITSAFSVTDGDSQVADEVKMTVLETVKHLPWTEQMSILEWYLQQYGHLNQTFFINF